MAASNLPAQGPELAPTPGTVAAGEIDHLWRMLHGRGEAIAAMAALARAPFVGELDEFPPAIRAQGATRLAPAPAPLHALLSFSAPGSPAPRTIPARNIQHAYWRGKGCHVR